MRKISNPAMLKRNKQIGTYGQLGGMGLLGAAVVVSFLWPERIDLMYLGMISGFILASVGNTFTNRWGRTPPPDQAIDDVLKGLDDRHTIVHFRLGAEHALFTPNGIVAILAKYERGRISFDGKKWRQTGVSGFMKFFGMEVLGDPVSDSEFEAENLTRKLRKILKTESLPPVQALIAFVNDKTRVEADSSPVPALHASKVKEHIRHLPKNPTLPPDQFRQVLEYLGEKA
ncbi:MAG: NERD domain-containing protein [Anaerolineales bacterium]|nr:NERD domain-containing protein [Anaerolineales bacterium]